MSASSKKKLRKEQNAALLTEKQQKAQAEAKKMKITTIVFVAVVLAIVVTFAAVLIVNTVKNSGVSQKHTIAATVDGVEINSVEFNYYYSDLLSNTYNQWYSSYGDSMSTYMSLMGLDLTKPLDEQTYSLGEEEDVTWADYFVESALERAKSDYTLYNAAVAAGHELTEDEQASYDSTLLNLTFYAQLYGYNNVNQYLRGMYGPGANEKSYNEYCMRSALASSYYTAYNDSLVYSETELDAYAADKLTNYNSYDYAYYYVNYTKFLKDGTKDDKGEVTYTDEQHAAARAEAKAAAQSLLKAKTPEELDAAVGALSFNAGSTVTANKSVNTLGTSVSSIYGEWLTNPGRQVNDIAMFAYDTVSTDADGKETTSVNGYYVVMFQGVSDNARPLGNVRHLLVKFEGGTKGENNETVYTAKEKEAAKTKAEGYLQTWKDGEATEESFIELVKANSQDSSASTGGLFEDITPTSSYVTNFLNWSIDVNRQKGDTEVIETEYGYHVMYYVGASELNYRDYMIAADKRSEDLTAWYESLIKDVTGTIGDLEYIDTSKILSAE